MKHTNYQARTAIANFIRDNSEADFLKIVTAIHDPKVIEEKLPHLMDKINVDLLTSVVGIEKVLVGPEPANALMVKFLLSDRNSTKDTALTRDVRFERTLSDRPSTFLEQLQELATLALVSRYGTPREILELEAQDVHHFEVEFTNTDLSDLSPEVSPTLIAGLSTITVPFTRKPAGKSLYSILTTLNPMTDWVATFSSRFPWLHTDTIAELISFAIADTTDPAIHAVLGAQLPDGTFFYSKTHILQLVPVWAESWTVWYKNLEQKIHDLIANAQISNVALNAFIKEILHPEA